jgi:hypothetical protein
MSELTFLNFEMTRNFFLKHAEALDEGTADIQPEGFNNNLRWHVGHVLMTAEFFLFGYPVESTFLPGNYVELFNRGTSPANWTGEVPSLEVLIGQLKDQLARIKEIPEAKLNEKLEKPFFDFQTYGETANFALFHETYHLGQMHAMKRLIEKQTVVHP